MKESSIGALEPAESSRDVQIGSQGPLTSGHTSQLASSMSVQQPQTYDQSKINFLSRCFVAWFGTGFVCGHVVRPRQRKKQERNMLTRE